MERSLENERECGALPGSYDDDDDCNSARCRARLYFYILRRQERPVGVVMQGAASRAEDALQLL